MSPPNAEDSLTGLPPQPPPPPPPPVPSSRRRRRWGFEMPDLDNIEDVYMYGPGGHHPVDLGDVIQQRYNIIHKLGNGGFALVWLARDLVQERYVALKILKADAPEREVKVLEHLRNTVGDSHITNLYETFTIRGPNGLHQCLVLRLGGPTLWHVILYCERPPLRFLVAAAKSLADGLAALHASGVGHGDLTHSNVLFEITGVQDWTQDDIYRYFGPPKTVPLLLLDGTPAPAFAPKNVVDAVDFPHLNMEQLSGNILITDFGEAFFKDNVPRGLGTPVSFYAPELLFGYQPSCAVDLWALGCLIFEIHTYRVLAPSFFGSTEEALAMAIETIGALPEAWQNSFCDKEKPLKAETPGEKHRWFDDQIQRSRTLDSQVLEHLPGISQDQYATFLQLLRSIVVFEPGCRLPAADVAQHPWFVCEELVEHEPNNCEDERSR